LAGKVVVGVPIAILLTLGAAVAFYAAFDSGIIRFNYPSIEKYPVRGIDVSHHQGAIDWPQVAATGSVDFAYIKATEGGDFKDPDFQKNWMGSKQAGIATGAYHFFTFCRPGKDQAGNFLQSVPFEPSSLPFAVDLEFDGNCSAVPSPEALASDVRDFVSTVRSVHRQRPVFYVTKEFFDHYMTGNRDLFPEHDLWVRNIFYEPRQQDCEKWRIWQYSHRGRMKGITGPVDLNVFCAGRDELKDFSVLGAPPQ